MRLYIKLYVYADCVTCANIFLQNKDSFNYSEKECKCNQDKYLFLVKCLINTNKFTLV